MELIKDIASIIRSIVSIILILGIIGLFLTGGITLKAEESYLTGYVHLGMNMIAGEHVASFELGSNAVMLTTNGFTKSITLSAMEIYAPYKIMNVTLAFPMLNSIQRGL